MSNFPKPANDAEIKANIVTILTQAAGSGTQPGSATVSLTGALSLSTIRSLLGNGATIQKVEALVNQLVDATTIVRNTNGKTAEGWTYSVA